MRALVTGATGFIGNQLILKLQELGWDVVCLVRRKVFSSFPQIHCLAADLADPNSLEVINEVTPAIDIVFHLGALLPGQEKTMSCEDFLVVNAISTCRLLTLAENLNINTFVYASSLPVLGKPTELPISEDHPLKPEHPYLLSKLTAELSCEISRTQKKMNVSSLRITSPYGPGMQSSVVLSQFVQKALRSENIEIYGSGQRIQNFIEVSDIVRACLLAAKTCNPGVYNVAGHSCSMLNLARKIVHTIPTDSEVVMSKLSDPQDEYRWEVDMTKSHKYLGYSPQNSFDEGLRNYVNWRLSGEKKQLWYRTQ